MARGGKMLIITSSRKSKEEVGITGPADEVVDLRLINTADNETLATCLIETRKEENPLSNSE
jgi:hypothetical protein